jgi:hypothetical protein
VIPPGVFWEEIAERSTKPKKPQKKEKDEKPFNRMQQKILQLVHVNKYGFLKSRTIQDCVAWAYEYIHQCK